MKMFLWSFISIRIVLENYCAVGFPLIQETRPSAAQSQVSFPAEIGSSLDSSEPSVPAQIANAQATDLTDRNGKINEIIDNGCFKESTSSSTEENSTKARVESQGVKSNSDSLPNHDQELGSQIQDGNNEQAVVKQNGCSISLTEFEDGEEKYNFPICQHTFHRDCIAPWVEVTNTCPYCREIMSPSKRYEDFKAGPNPQVMRRIQEDRSREWESVMNEGLRRMARDERRMRPEQWSRAYYDYDRYYVVVPENRTVDENPGRVRTSTSAIRKVMTRLHDWKDCLISHFGR